MQNFQRVENTGYALCRNWDESKPYAMIIGLNPSTADENENDPTITRCINFAKSWGYGGVCVTNLFALRATVPSDMKTSNDPIGTENDAWLYKLAREAAIIVAARGNDGSYLNRSGEILGALLNLHCIKMNKSGEPCSRNASFSMNDFVDSTRRDPKVMP